MDDKMLTTEQMEVAKKMLVFAQNFSDQIVQIMKHHDLWDKGFEVRIDITPGFEAFTQEIQLKRWVEDGDGYFKEMIDRAKSKLDDSNRWHTIPCLTTREFIHLFDEEKVGTGKAEGKPDEKPLPPDGLWVGADRNCDPVDGWEWDLNDSMS